MKKVKILLIAMTMVRVGATSVCFAAGRDSPDGGGSTAIKETVGELTLTIRLAQ